MHGRQLAGDQVLRHVGILKLIHHHVLELVLVLMQYLGEVAEKYVGVKQQVVEIHRIGLETTDTVSFVEATDLWHPGGVVVGLNDAVV